MQRSHVNPPLPDSHRPEARAAYLASRRTAWWTHTVPCFRSPLCYSCSGLCGMGRAPHGPMAVFLECEGAQRQSQAGDHLQMEALIEGKPKYWGWGWRDAADRVCCHHSILGMRGGDSCRSLLSWQTAEDRQCIPGRAQRAQVSLSLTHTHTIFHAYYVHLSDLNYLRRVNI